MRWEETKYPFSFGAKLPDNRKELYNEFIEFFGFNKMAFADGVGSYERLLYGLRSYNNTKLNYNWGRPLENVPDHDHARVFKIQGTDRIVYVNQPYQFNKERLEKWCVQRNLVYVICDKKYSFYYPERTELILIMSNDTYIDFLNFSEFPRRWEAE